jgi:hypothetical protein
MVINCTAGVDKNSRLIDIISAAEHLLGLNDVMDEGLHRVLAGDLVLSAFWMTDAVCPKIPL